MTLLNQPDINADINKRRGVAQRGINQGTYDVGQGQQGGNVAPLLTRNQNISAGGPDVYTIEEQVEEFFDETDEPKVTTADDDMVDDGVL